MLRAPRSHWSKGTTGLACALIAVVLFGTSAIAACSSSQPEATDAGTNAETDANPSRPTDAGASLCVDGRPAPYPKGPPSGGVALFAPMPPLSLPALGGDTFSFVSRFEPCAPRSKILLVRQTAAFCGPCLWSQKHTNDLVPADLAARVELIDLLVSDRNNVAVRTSADLARVEAELGSHAAILAADPAYVLQSVGLGDRRLPFFALVDSRTMIVREALPDPEPERLSGTLRRELAILDGAGSSAVPPMPNAALEDDVFPRHHWELLHDMVHPGRPPADPTNAVADSSAAASLGKELFFDTRFSSNGTVACSSCHIPEKGYADGRPRSTGLAEGDRNTPSILYASHARFHFWDGRVDTLWLQATGPIENPLEMDSTRLEVAHRIYDQYKDRYEAIFPTLPPLTDTARFPARGKPGDRSWDGMARADQREVTSVLVGVGKLLEAFERTITAAPNALDRYLAGDRAALTDAQKRGLGTFFTAGCAQCHHGPRLTDDAFHNIRFATGRRDGTADLGAALGLPALVKNPLRSREWADGPFQEIWLPTNAPELVGAFRTPTLRGSAATAPYGHGGSLSTLPEVIRHYAFQGLARTDLRAAGETEAWVSIILEQNRGELAEALTLFTSPVTTTP